MPKGRVEVSFLSGVQIIIQSSRHFITENKNEIITKDTERQDTLESEFEGENEGKDVDTSDTDNLGESLNDSRRSDAAGQKTRANSSMNGILGGLKHTSTED